MSKGWSKSAANQGVRQLGSSYCLVAEHALECDLAKVLCKMTIQDGLSAVLFCVDLHFWLAPAVLAGYAVTAWHAVPMGARCRLGARCQLGSADWAHCAQGITTVGVRCSVLGIWAAAKNLG